ncbi:MAG: CoA transferase, partial [Pseudomonadota bacterium]|nr:CoA transferase [Pseudomonadota bacterium]
QINARSWTIPIVEKAIGERNYQQLLEDFEKLGTPYSPINKPSELFEDPHVLRDGGLVQSNMADGRTFRAPALPFEIDGRMMSANGDLPSIGQETNRILSELGLSEAEIEAARGPLKAAAE